MTFSWQQVVSGDGEGAALVFECQRRMQAIMLDLRRELADASDPRGGGSAAKRDRLDASLKRCSSPGERRAIIMCDTV